MASENTTRDAEIVERYKIGETQQQLATAYELTRTRIQQILAKAGISYKDSPRVPRGDRNDFVGANITKTMKVQLQHEAQRTGKSMSRVVEELLETNLPPSNELDRKTDDA